MKILTITGHRPQKIGGYDPDHPLRRGVYRAMEREIRRIKPDILIQGMALGVDQDSAKIAIKLGIPFHAYVPFEGQEKKWHEKAQLEYHELLRRAEKVVHVCEPGFEYWKMHKRNEAMVDVCTEVLAVYDGGKDGGTKHCVDYARKQNKPITAINPKEIDMRTVDQKLQSVLLYMTTLSERMEEYNPNEVSACLDRLPPTTKDALAENVSAMRNILDMEGITLVDTETLRDLQRISNELAGT